MLEYFIELTLAYQVTRAVLGLEEQVPLVLLLHEAHAGVGLIEAVARDVQTSRPLANDVYELVLGGDRLPKSHLLLRLLNGFDDGIFLFLEFQSDKICFTFGGPFDVDWARVQKCDINFRLFLVLLVEERLFEVLKLAKYYFLALQLVLAAHRVRVIPFKMCLQEFLVQVTKIHQLSRRILA